MFFLRFGYPALHLAGDQVADEFFLSVRISEEIGCEKILPVCFAGNGTGRPFGDTASESEAPVMSLHLPFQFFSGCGDGAQSGEITSFHMKTECVQVSEAGSPMKKKFLVCRTGGSISMFS